MLGTPQRKTASRGGLSEIGPGVLIKGPREQRPSRVFGSSRVAGVFNRCATSHQVAQSHCTEQGFHLYPSGDVRHGWTRAERDFVEIIDGSQSAWVKLAEDHSLS